MKINEKVMRFWKKEFIGYDPVQKAYEDNLIKEEQRMREEQERALAEEESNIP